MRCPPIPYVPVVDKVQETLAAKKEPRYDTFELPNKMKFKVHIWETGTPEEFLNHVKQALNTCERVGHFENYKKALQTRKKARRSAKKEEETIKTLRAEKASGVLLTSAQEKRDDFLEEVKKAEAE